MFISVLAEDGFTYERSAIEQWFKNNNRSPMTNMPIGKSLQTNKAIKMILDVVKVKA